MDTSTITVSRPKVVSRVFATALHAVRIDWHDDLTVSCPLLTLSDKVGVEGRAQGLWQTIRNRRNKSRATVVRHCNPGGP